MKKIFYGCIFFTAVTFIFQASPIYSAQKAEDKRRFQLFNAEYNSSLIQQSKTTNFLEKRLFKIDTQTGETWILIDVLKDGRYIKFWRPIRIGDDK